MTGDCPESAVAGLWREIKKMDSYKNHPAHDMNDELLSRTLPVTIHGDGAEMFRDNEFFVWSWSSVLSSFGLVSDVLMQKIPICIVPEHQMQSSADPRLSKSPSVRARLLRR